MLGVQSGFRAGRSTVEQTMALRYILDMCRVSKRMTTIIYVDFNKAFDSIDQIKSNQTLFSNLYKYKHVIHDEIYILEKRMEKKLK